MRLISAAFVAILVLFVSAAQSADTLDVHLVSQTSTTITLGWTPQAGYGYLFFDDCTTIDTGCSLVSRTNNANASTVTFAKGHNIYKVSVITEGNRGTYTTVPPVDTTPPTVSVTAPANGSTVSGTISETATASDNVGVTRVEFLRDGVLYATDTTAPYSASFNTTTVANGSHTFGARAFDAANNVGTATNVTVTVSNAPVPDTTVPVISMTSPADGTTVSGMINISANATDNIGVVRVDFYRDFVVIGTDTTAPYAISDNTTLLSNGAHGWGARAYDAAGNEGFAPAVHNTVSNNVPPPVTQCSDGIDNADPEDTLVDLADPGCVNAADNDETDVVAGACSKSTPNVPDGPDGMGGCFPGPASTGVPAGTTLAAHAGSCTLASGTYDAQTFNCDPVITGTVTITRSRVNGSIQVNSSGNLTITDAYVDASPNGPRETRAIWNDNGGIATITRNELVGGNGTVWCNNCTIRDSYVHGQEIQDPWHASAVRADQNSTIVHNSLWCEAQPVGQEGGCSADLTGYPDFNPTNHWTIERNLLMSNVTGNAFCAYGGGTSGKPYSNDSTNATYIVFRDNVFQRGSNGNCGSYGPITDFIVGRTGNVWTNNKFDNGATVNPG